MKNDEDYILGMNRKDGRNSRRKRNIVEQPPEIFYINDGFNSTMAVSFNRGSSNRRLKRRRYL